MKMRPVDSEDTNKVYNMASEPNKATEHCIPDYDTLPCDNVEIHIESESEHRCSVAYEQFLNASYLNTFKVAMLTVPVLCELCMHLCTFGYTTLFFSGNGAGG